MLWTICVILLILWAVGFFTGTTVNGLVHILLVLAVIVVIIEVVRMATRGRSS